MPYRKPAKAEENCKNIQYCSAEIKVVYYKWFMFCTLNQMFVINNGVSFSVSIPYNPLVIFLFDIQKSLLGAN